MAARKKKTSVSAPATTEPDHDSPPTPPETASSDGLGGERSEVTQQQRRVPVEKAAPKIRKILVRNVSLQLQTISVISDDASLAEVRLPPRETYGPVYEDRMTAHTKQLRDRGAVRFITTS